MGQAWMTLCCTCKHNCKTFLYTPNTSKYLSSLISYLGSKKCFFLLKTGHSMIALITFLANVYFYIPQQRLYLFIKQSSHKCSLWGFELGWNYQNFTKLASYFVNISSMVKNWLNYKEKALVLHIFTKLVESNF